MLLEILYSRGSQPFSFSVPLNKINKNCVPPLRLCVLHSGLFIRFPNKKTEKDPNITNQDSNLFLCVPPGNLSRPTRGTRPPGWEPLLYSLKSHKSLTFISQQEMDSKGLFKQFSIPGTQMNNLFILRLKIFVQINFAIYLFLRQGVV